MQAVIASVRVGLIAEGKGEVGTATSERKEREWRADPHDGL